MAVTLAFLLCCGAKSKGFAHKLWHGHANEYGCAASKDMNVTNDYRDTSDSVEVAGWCFGACLTIAAIGMASLKIMELFE